jgi:WD40 repeat protein
MPPGFAPEDRSFDWIAGMQLLAGVALIVLDVRILWLGFEYNSRDPLAEVVPLLTGVDGVPKTEGDYLAWGLLFFLGSAYIASGLLTLNRRTSAFSPLRILHAVLLSGAALGVVVASFSFVFRQVWSILLIPCVLMAWTSYRFLKRLRSWDVLADTPEKSPRLRAPLVTAAISSLWFLAFAFVSWEPVRPSYTIGHPDVQNSGWGVDRIWFSPDGRLLAYSHGPDILFFDSSNGRTLHKDHAPDSFFGAFSHNSRVFALAGPPGLRTYREGKRIWEDRFVRPSDALLGWIQIWSLPSVRTEGRSSSGQLSRMARPCRCDPSALSFAPDDLSLLVGSSDGMVWRLEISTGEFREAFRAYEGSPPGQGEERVPSLSVISSAGDGQTLITVGRDDTRASPSCKLWDARTYALKKTFPLDDSEISRGGSLSPGTHAIALPDKSGYPYVWDLETGRRRGPVGKPHDHTAFSPSGDVLVVSSDRKIDVLAFPSLQPLSTIAPWHQWPAPIPPLLAVSSEGLVATGGGDYPDNAHTIRVWRIGQRHRS